MPDDDFSFCPYCMGELEEREESAACFNLNVGDANAIEGGVHMSDSHSIDSHNVHTTDSHNIQNSDSHNVHTETHNTWITQQERQKTPEEIQAENEKEFRLLVRNVYEDGRISDDERRNVISKISELNIDPSTAKRIMDQEQSLARRRVKDRSLNEAEYALIRAVIEAVKANDKDGLLEFIDDLKLLNGRVDNGEVQYFYYMLLSALTPEEFISIAENDNLGIDCFWKTVWLSMAYRISGKKRSVAVDYKFHEYTESVNEQFPGNIELALCIDNLKEAHSTKTKFKADMLMNFTKSKFEVYSSNHQDYLNDLGNAIASIIEGTLYPDESRFYIESFFPGYVSKMADVIKAKEDEDALFAPLITIPQMPRIPVIEG